VSPPEFEETGGATVVTFRVPVVGAESRAESRHRRILERFAVDKLSKSGLATKVGLRSVTDRRTVRRLCSNSNARRRGAG